MFTNIQTGLHNYGRFIWSSLTAFRAAPHLRFSDALLRRNSARQIVMTHECHYKEMSMLEIPSKSKRKKPSQWR